MLNNDEKTTEPAEKFFNSDEIQRHTNISREEEIKKTAVSALLFSFTVLFVLLFLTLAQRHVFS